MDDNHYIPATPEIIGALDRFSDSEKFLVVHADDPRLARQYSAFMIVDALELASLINAAIKGN